MGNKGPFPQMSLSKGVGFFASKGARGAAGRGRGRGLTSRAGAGFRVHAGEERPPKQANRLLGQLDALAAAGGEAFIAPGGGALAQPSRRAPLLSPSGSTNRRGGAHCGKAPAPLPCVPRRVHRRGAPPTPPRCRVHSRVRAQSRTSHRVHREHSPPACPPLSTAAAASPQKVHTSRL